MTEKNKTEIRVEGYSTLCVMRENDVSIHAIATARVDGRVTIFDYAKREHIEVTDYIQSQAPVADKGRMIMLPILEAEKRVEQNIDKFVCRDWFEIPYARYYEMLCCLPPENLKRLADATIFRLCEYQIADVTRHFAIFEGRAFEGIFRKQDYANLLTYLRRTARETPSLIETAVNQLVNEFTNKESARYQWLRETWVPPDKFSDRWPVPKTVWHINCGHCEDFANALAERVPGGELVELDDLFINDRRMQPDGWETMTEEAKDDWVSAQVLPSHKVYRYLGRFYDSQHPHGVSDWTELEVYIYGKFGFSYEQWKEWKENMAKTKTKTGHVLMVWSTGLFEIGPVKLPGSLAVAYGPKEKLEECLSRLGQLSREDNKSWYCPGVSLAKSEGRDAVEEVLKFQKKAIEFLQKDQ